MLEHICRKQLHLSLQFLILNLAPVYLYKFKYIAYILSGVYGCHITALTAHNSRLPVSSLSGGGKSEGEVMWHHCVPSTDSASFPDGTQGAMQNVQPQTFSLVGTLSPQHVTREPFGHVALHIVSRADAHTQTHTFRIHTRSRFQYTPLPHT